MASIIQGRSGYTAGNRSTGLQPFAYGPIYCCKKQSPEHWKSVSDIDLVVLHGPTASRSLGTPYLEIHMYALDTNGHKGLLSNRAEPRSVFCRPMPGRPGPRGRLPGRGFGRGGWATRSPMCMPQYCSPSTVPAPRPPAVPPPQPPAIPPPQAPSVPPPKSTAMQPPAAPVVDPAAAFSGTRGKKGGLQSRGRGRGRAWQKSEGARVPDTSRVY